MSGPVIHLDFVRSRGLRRFSEPGARDRIDARAGLMALFATRVGGAVARADLTEALRAREDTSAATVAQVLAAAGQPAGALTSLIRTPAIGPPWPR